MLEEHHYFSKKLIRTVVLCLAAAVVSGCSMSTYDNKQWFKTNDRGFLERLKKNSPARLVSVDALIMTRLKNVTTLAVRESKHVRPFAHHDSS